MILGFSFTERLAKQWQAPLWEACTEQPISETMAIESILLNIL